MNERVRFRLVENGQPLRIMQLDAMEGVTLEGETDTLPRGLTLNFWGANPIMEYRLRRVAQLRGWSRFKAVAERDSGELILRGVDENALPGGMLRVQLNIADLRTPEMPIDVEVKEDQEITVDVRVQPDARRVVLTGPVSTFDEQIRRVLEDPGSIVEGRPVAEWLEQEGPRPRRKACLLNLMAKLRAAAAPTPKKPLIRTVRSVFFADVDRVYSIVTGEFHALLVSLAEDPKKPFYAEGTPAAAIHQRLLGRAGADAASYDLQSFRQEGRPSMQAVVAVPKERDPNRDFYAELDIDLGNPLQDVVGALIHFGEVITPGKTDHLKLHQKLNKGVTKDFLHYRVVEG